MFDRILKVAWFVAFAVIGWYAVNVYREVEIAKANSNQQGTIASAPEEEDLGFPFAKCMLRTGETQVFEMDPRTLEIWMDTPEEFLADLKDVGGTCEVTVTNGYQSQINSSAGTATSQSFGTCRLGNPIDCGRFWLNPDTYVLTWGANNDSAGFMAKFRER